MGSNIAVRVEAARGKSSCGANTGMGLGEMPSSYHWSTTDGVFHLMADSRPCPSKPAHASCMSPRREHVKLQAAAGAEEMSGFEHGFRHAAAGI